MGQSSSGEARAPCLVKADCLHWHLSAHDSTFHFQSGDGQLLSLGFQGRGPVVDELPPSWFSKFLSSRAEVHGAPHAKAARHCAPPGGGLFPGESKNLKIIGFSTLSLHRQCSLCLQVCDRLCNFPSLKEQSTLDKGEARGSAWLQIPAPTTSSCLSFFIFKIRIIERARLLWGLNEVNSNKAHTTLLIHDYGVLQANFI